MVNAGGDRPYTHKGVNHDIVYVKRYCTKDYLSVYNSQLHTPTHYYLLTLSQRESVLFGKAAP